MARRHAVAFFLGDASFLADPKFRALARRLPDSDDFNSAVGAYWIALAASRRNGLPKVSLETETSSRFIDDLRAVGLILRDGFPDEPWRDWGATSPQQAAAGRARAAGAERTALGTFTSGASSPSALDGLDQRVQPSPPLLSTPLPRGRTTPARAPARGDADDEEIEVVAWLARHGCALSETNGLRRHIVLLVERFGADAVVGKLDRLAEAGVMDGDARGFVFGAEEALFPKPDMKALDREDRAEDEATAFDRRVDQTQRQMRAIYGAEKP